jgi:hypothetical protein
VSLIRKVVANLHRRWFLAKDKRVYQSDDLKSFMIAPSEEEAKALASVILNS